MEPCRVFHIAFGSLAVWVASLTRRVFERTHARIARLELTVLELYELSLLKLEAARIAIAVDPQGRRAAMGYIQRRLRMLHRKYNLLLSLLVPHHGLT